MSRSLLCRSTCSHCSSTARFFSSSHSSLTRAQSATAARKFSYSCARRARSGSRCECASAGQLRQARLGARELHGEQCLLDLERRRALQTPRQSDEAQGPDQPLGRIPLPPAHAVAVVVREDVVEVVVALAVGDHRQHRVVARGVVLGVRPRAPHVGEGVDEEGDVVAPHQAHEAGEDQHAPDVPDDETGQQRQAEVGEHREQHVVTVLEREHRVALQVRNVGEVLLARSGTRAASSRCARTRSRAAPSRDPGRSSSTCR